MNVAFTYLYRDGANFKTWSSVVFSNPGGLGVSEVTRSLTLAFEVDGLFIADRVRIPEIFPFAQVRASVDDHCYHEFHSVENTPEELTDDHHRAISEFLNEVRRESIRGWAAFDVFNRLRSRVPRPK